MKGPRLILTLVITSLIILLLPLVWIGQRALELEEREEKAKWKTAQEENIRLSLWRMDTQLSLFLARENSRPHYHYASFFAQRSRTKRAMAGKISFRPSPLLSSTPKEVSLYFQIDGEGSVTSPQMPGKRWIKIAEKRGWKKERARQVSEKKKKLEKLLSQKILSASLPPGDQEKKHIASALKEQQSSLPQQEKSNLPQQRYYSPKFQTSKSNREWQKRSQFANQAGENLKKVQKMLTLDFVDRASSQPIREEILHPFWHGGELFLVRRVHYPEGTHFQGFWINWPLLKKKLLQAISDLLPRAQLRPLAAEEEAPRRLASLPMELLPGSPPLKIEREEFSPLHLSLLIGGACALLAVISVVVLVLGLISLSERRGAFVSAVTHELRTPLTTFRIYAEMLETGRVKEEKKPRYFKTLRREAERLYHLVENVLAYAQLEKNKGANKREKLTARALIDRCRDRLKERAREAGMEWREKWPPPTGEGQKGEDLVVYTDPTAAGQILFNLVDNGCKYGRGEEIKRLELKVEERGEKIAISLTDWGPGLNRKERKNLFKPFRKSAEKAAQSAPGVGLGLSLCRKLARNLKGSLLYDSTYQDGARFILLLPRG